MHILLCRSRFSQRPSVGFSLPHSIRFRRSFIHRPHQRSPSSRQSARLAGWTIHAIYQQERCSRQLATWFSKHSALSFIHFYPLFFSFFFFSVRIYGKGVGMITSWYSASLPIKLWESVWKISSWKLAKIAHWSHNNKHNSQFFLSTKVFLFSLYN